MNAIELSHVCKHFPGFSIQDLTFAVPSGTICGLVGENGAGKSTTIRLLMGALRPDSGTCSALGVDTSSPEVLAIKEDVGVVLDEAYFPEVLNADQVGRVMTRTYQRWDAKVYAAYLRRFDLPLKKAFKDFSRGQLAGDDLGLDLGVDLIVDGLVGGVADDEFHGSHSCSYCTFTVYTVCTDCQEGNAGSRKNFCGPWG